MKERKQLPAIFCHVVTEHKQFDADGKCTQRKQSFMLVPEWLEFFNELNVAIQDFNHPQFLMDMQDVDINNIKPGGITYVGPKNVSETAAGDATGGTDGTDHRREAGTSNRRGTAES